MIIPKTINFDLVSDEKAIEICRIFVHKNNFIPSVIRTKYLIMVEFQECKNVFGIKSNGEMSKTEGKQISSKSYTLFNPEAYYLLINTQWINPKDNVPLLSDAIEQFGKSIKIAPVIMKKEGVTFEGKYVFYRSGVERFECGQFQQWEDDLTGVPDYWMLKSNLITKGVK